MNNQPTIRPRRATATASEIAQLQIEHSAEVSRRAELAGRSILRLFGKRAFHMPDTLICAVQTPENRTRTTRLSDWHFWWQAHLLDCTVDASLRAHREYDSQNATEWFENAQRILRGIHTRNFGLWTNSYYDDMAWLVLAAGRLNALATLLHGRGYMPAQDAGHALFSALHKGRSLAKGGMYWSSKKDFRNTPATAPAALAFLRAQEPETALDLINWLNNTLWDAERRVFLDGMRAVGSEEKLEEGIFSYNQGPILGALVEAAEGGHSLNVEISERIADILDGIEQHFTIDFAVSGAEHIQILRTQGTGDAGLFTAILVRYLAQVALAESLTAEVRQKARDWVIQTAEILWDGRREFDPDLPLNEPGIDVTEIRGEPVVLFSTDIARHSSGTLPPGAPVELSCQLQGWMIQEAAARVLAETL